MRKILIIMITILIFSNITFGQKRNNKVKIKSMATSEVPLVKKYNDTKGTISERVFTTAIIIGESILLLAIVGYWRRIKGDSVDESKSIFKKNINAIRLEKVRRFENKKLSMERKTLYSKIDKTLVDGKYITKKAKKLKVAKGEIFLATRIRQLSKQTI